MKGKLWRNIALGIATLMILLAACYALWPRPRVFVATYTLDKGAIQYSGETRQVVFDGRGKLKFKNGDVYQGEFKAGTFDGDGRYVSHEGWVFIGHFEKGKISGEGRLETDREVYTGTFKNGVLQRDKQNTKAN